MPAMENSRYWARLLAACTGRPTRCAPWALDAAFRRAGPATTPGGKAMFQMMGVFAEFERAIIVERVKAGLARARADGKRLGRPRLDAAAIRAELAEGVSLRQTARRLGCSLSTVKRVAKAAA